MHGGLGVAMGKLGGRPASEVELSHLWLISLFLSRRQHLVAGILQAPREFFFGEFFFDH